MNPNRVLDNQIRTQLIHLLCSHPPLTTRDGRDAWLMNLPSGVRDLVPRRHDRCKDDLAFIIDAVQSLQLADGRWPILILIDALLPEMENLRTGHDLKVLRRKISHNLGERQSTVQDNQLEAEEDTYQTTGEVPSIWQSVLPEQSPLENPFFHRTPIRDQRFFFGRTAETRKVLGPVTRKQSVSVVGPRRIGKSSFLLHLCDPQVKVAHRLGDDYVFVYVDCQVLSKDLTKSDVYRELSEDVIEATQGGYSARRGAGETMTSLTFMKYLDDITAPGRQIVFLFDEFEAIADNHRLGQDFFTELRGLCDSGRAAYVTASGETLYDLSFHDKNILNSPFFNPFYTVWLSFMKPQEARDLVDGLAAMADFEGFDENDHTFLRGIAGTHPFYLQVACYLLFEEKSGRTHSTTPDYDRVESQFAREVRDHFRYIWNRLSDGEKGALRLIDEGRLDKVAEEDMERLEQECLVYQGAVFSSSFAKFVRRQLRQPLDSPRPEYDVFLCHNSDDKPAVKEIGRSLKERGILPWLDEWELRPGLPWQRLLDQQIAKIDSAAVFVGRGGIGPWQQLELEAFLREFVERGCPVIPVLLPDAPKKPRLPVFLRGMTWVDFRKRDPDPMKRLIWGITGKRDRAF
jgi:hypothetical protein